VGTNIQGIHNKGKEFPKGVSGNPKGRPPKTVTEYLREYGEASSIDGKITITTTAGKVIEKVIKADVTSPDKERIMTINGAVGLTVLQGALSGDLGMIKEYLDRTEGKAKQEIKLESDNTNRTPENKLDYSKLNREQLLELRELKLKALEIEKQCVTE